LGRISRQRDRAVERGDLRDAEEPAEALERIEGEVEALQVGSEEASSRLAQREQDTEEAATQLEEFSRQLTEADKELTAANSDLREIRDSTDTVARAVESSGLVDLDPVVLDDHADTVTAILCSVKLHATEGMLLAAEGAAAERRAIQSLDSRGLPPARADIADLCEDMRRRRLGARPGWDYLATLDEAVAAACAAAHPGLADGVVVVVPDDIEPVTAFLREQVSRLTGPVVVAAPDEFHRDDQLPADADDPATHIDVVLPHEAFWSTPAAGEELDRRHGGDSHQKELVRCP
jgi:hypothetical protein